MKEEDTHLVLLIVPFFLFYAGLFPCSCKFGVDSSKTIVWKLTLDPLALVITKELHSCTLITSDDECTGQSFHGYHCSRRAVTHLKEHVEPAKICMS